MREPIGEVSGIVMLVWEIEFGIAHGRGTMTVWVVWVNMEMSRKPFWVPKGLLRSVSGLPILPKPRRLALGQVDREAVGLRLFETDPLDFLGTTVHRLITMNGMFLES